jgi:hypothetical protein
MTELVVVSRPRMRYLKWIGGGIYKTYLAPINTPQVDLIKPDYNYLRDNSNPHVFGLGYTCGPADYSAVQQPAFKPRTY